MSPGTRSGCVDPGGRREIPSTHRSIRSHEAKLSFHGNLESMVSKPNFKANALTTTRLGLLFFTDMELKIKKESVRGGKQKLWLANGSRVRESQVYNTKPTSGFFRGQGQSRNAHCQIVPNPINRL